MQELTPGEVESVTEYFGFFWHERLILKRAKKHLLQETLPRILKGLCHMPQEPNKILESYIG